VPPSAGGAAKCSLCSSARSDCGEICGKKLGFSVSYAAEITAETWCDLIFFMLRRNLRLKSFEKLGFNVLLLQRNLL
jgi:hypothetical protein